MWILEHRSKHKGAIQEENAIVGVFSTKEKAEQWLGLNASTYDEQNKDYPDQYWYWFVLYYEVVDFPIVDLILSNDPRASYDLFIYDFNGELMDYQPISGYIKDKTNDSI